MATKRYDPAATDFNGRYRRWVAALESGDEVAGPRGSVQVV